MTDASRQSRTLRCGSGLNGTCTRRVPGPSARIGPSRPTVTGPLRGAPREVFQQSAQPLPTDYLSQAGNRFVLRRRPARNDQLVVEPLVRSLFVVMRYEFADQVV